MSKPVRCPVCNDELICHHSPAIAKSGFTAYMECLGCDIFFASRTAKTESGARRLAIKAAREWIAKLKTCQSAGWCALQAHETRKTYQAVRVPARPPKAPPSMPNGMVIYGCGMPDTVVMYMASDPAVVYEHIPPTVTVTKITPEDLINGAAVATTSADSANITPVYSAPGNGMALTLANMGRLTGGADAVDSIIETCNKLIKESDNVPDKD